jgi:hypothetical protein
MAKSARRRTDNVVNMTVGDTPRERETLSESIEDAIARRAFERYCARGCQDGQDVDDWLNAEREVRAERTSTAA